MRDDIEVAAAGRDDDRAMKSPPEQHGGDAVRVEIMGIDQPEILPLADLASQKWQGSRSKNERRRAHADLGQRWIARMIDAQSLSGFRRRDLRKGRIPAEARGRKRKPRTGRDDPGADHSALDQLVQTGFDEDPVLGLRCARI